MDGLGVKSDERTWKQIVLGKGEVGVVKGVALFEGKKRAVDGKGKAKTQSG